MAELKFKGDNVPPELKFGEISVTHSRAGVPTYRVELWHEGLNRHRLIRASDARELEKKASLLATEWANRWLAIRAREDGKELATARTEEARQAIKALELTLAGALTSNAAIRWDDLRDETPFPTPAPDKPARPRYPEEPNRSENQFRATPSLLDRVFGRVPRLEVEAERKWRRANARWQERTESLDAAYREASVDFDRAHEAWQSDKAAYEEQQRRKNAAIDFNREGYESSDGEAVEWYFERVLSASDYPDWMPQEFNLEMRSDSEMLLVSYSLPTLDAMPRLREVTYVASREEMREKNLTDAQAKNLYDSLLYSIALRTVHEILESDYAGTVKSVVFNGYVTAIDPSNGKVATTCILSLQATRDEFEDLDLANVNPKACFRALRGVGSSKLHSMVAVAPILEMSRTDARFVSSREVTGSLDESVNLAAMDWEDFEHLTREIFEAEFRSHGGEVKVTQSSRDGGVDAIAFDPDPIRGGKIVIQAKRYTNTVSVAAVRDLYGAVMNEGATKGILVTTSDYGPDAYRFAKDKPLTLMNGSNLLHLLEKHGHRAHIDRSVIVGPSAAALPSVSKDVAERPAESR